MATDIKPAINRTVPTIGTILGGSYRLTRLLAEGGCGNVYVATHERLGSEIAVKVLHAGLAGNTRLLVRLRQEADILSAVRHPHIVQILDFDVTEWGVPFLVMELLQGQPLTERAVSGAPFDPRAATHVIDQIAQALVAAHAHGVVHLDLKPDNVILISTDGRDDFVKIIDFGISRAIWQARLINEPVVAGTPEYMAPEQAGGLTDEIDHRTDQFALAALSYRLLTGHEPFAGADPAAILERVVNDTPKLPSEHAPGLGAGVDGVILRGLSKRPADRYPNVPDFAEALREAVDAIAVDRRHVRRDVSRPPRRWGSVLRLTLALALALAAAAALAWFSPPTRTATRWAWRQAGAKARWLLATATARLAGGPDRPSGATGP
jgi:eukaryotic-like serine/threonine-protein kinase